MALIRGCAALVLVAVFTIGSGHAQQITLPAEGSETNRAPIIPFLEGTDVFWTARDDGQWFPNKLEANIFPHLVAAQNFSDLITVEAQDARGPENRKEFAYVISGTPAVRIRMLRDVSAPVRTPSYMPRVNAQFLWARGLKEALREAEPTNGSLNVQLAALPSIGLWEAHVIVGHHSNGQDGCLSTEQVRVPSDTGECAPTNAVVTKETINRVNGSFSTNYVRTGISYSRNWMPGTTDLQAVREARGGVAFEYHPRALVDDDIEDLYGRARMHLSGAYAARGVRPCERRLEGSSQLVWNPGVVDTVPKWSTTVQLSCYPWANGGWGLFARFYTGQDYYNVGFLDEITRFHVGVTFDQSGFFRFARASE